MLWDTINQKNKYSSLLLFFYLFFIYFCFILCQPWLAFTQLSIRQTIFTFFISGSLFCIYGLFLSRKVFRPYQAEPGISISKNLTFWIWIALSIYGLYSIWDLLKFPMHTWGDEDHHFYVTEQLLQYIHQLTSLKIPQDLPAGFFRYPNLVNFVSGFFLKIFSPWIANEVLQRFSLLTFVLPLQIFFLYQKEASLRRLSWIVATSPLLLSYISDKYLDIAHPLLIFFALQQTLDFLETSRNSSWLNALCFSSLSFFARDNIFPTSILICLVVSTKLLIDNRKSKPLGNFYSSAFQVLLHPLILSFLPIFSFLLLKKIALGNTDSSRLSVSFLFHQNYKDFFLLIWMYLPWIPLLILPWIWTKVSPLKKIMILISFLSLGFQFFLYSTFQPGWMPWSRNYLMFYGQILFITWVILQTVHEKNISQKGIGSLGVILQLLLQILLIPQLNKNKFFHENEIIYDYPAVFSYLISPEISQRCPRIFSNLPIEKPQSWKKAEANLKKPISIETLSTKSKEPLFENYENMIINLPSSELCFILHYRRNTSMIPILNSSHQIERPEQLDKNHTLLKDFQDPLSEGKSGLLIIYQKDPRLKTSISL